MVEKHPIAVEAIDEAINRLVARGYDEAMLVLADLRQEYEVDHALEIHLCFSVGRELATFMPGRCPKARGTLPEDVAAKVAAQIEESCRHPERLVDRPEPRVTQTQRRVGYTAKPCRTPGCEKARGHDDGVHDQA